MKIENVMTISSILLLLALGVRAKLETEMIIQNNKILKLEEQIKSKVKYIQSLQKQLGPLKYSQPLDQIIISSITGIRVNPMGGGTERLHKGVDLIGKKGDPVKALLSGKVVEHWLVPGRYNGEYFSGHEIYGGYIVIDHGNELFSSYGHLSKTFVREDQWVEAEEQIGELGTTGSSTGPHLHLEIIINPFRYLKERKIAVSD